MTESTIIAFEDRLRTAMLASDVAELDALIAPDLVCVAPGGTLVTKADDLATHASGALKIARLDPQERVITLLTDAAVVVVLMEVAAQQRADTFEGRMRYTRVWRHDPQGWRIAVAHLSLVA